MIAKIVLGTSLICLGLLITSTGCNETKSATADSAPDLHDASDRIKDEPKVAGSSGGREFHERLLKAAHEYPSFGLIDNQMNWAPAACAAPNEPPAVTFSSSSDADSHGSKLYFLFASDAASYLYAKKKVSPVGQTIVKESWHALPIDKLESNRYADHSSGHQVRRYTSRGDKFYQAGDQRELFIMFKTAPDKPGTDQGWVYGVVSADAKTVVAAGRLDNCMSCHVDAGVDRLFGPKSPPPFPATNHRGTNEDTDHSADPT